MTLVTLVMVYTVMSVLLSGTEQLTRLLGPNAQFLTVKMCFLPLSGIFMLTTRNMASKTS